jgi:membrane protease YdiL (CAAX protease family)
MVALTFAPHEGRDIIVPPQTPDRPPAQSLTFLLGSALGWSIGSVAAAVIAGFLGGFIVTVAGLMPVIGDADKTAIFRSLGIIGSAVLFFCAALGCARAAGAGSVRAGLGGLRIRRPLITAALVLVMMAYALALAFWIDRANPQVLASLRTLHWWALAPYAFALAIAAPLGEELFFRGWLWTGLRQHWGTLLTAAVSTVVWLALHAPEGVAVVVLLLPLALALPLARRFGGSVGASLAVHVAYNTTVTFAPWALVWAGVLALPA